MEEIEVISHFCPRPFMLRLMPSSYRQGIAWNSWKLQTADRKRVREKIIQLAFSR